ncbi:MAG TPA: hypothetical protein DCL80_08700 [Balneola sp.]|jgi:hypothetical protein|nr:hypothetical protein [Balneola sp.]MAO78106.1 hypothetical protein [Balneola sp.]MBF64107.1 hypothetical protein [Balneola sp.]HAH51330.1 hypothetical protein [Balneola sp.]|tara:strand:+ start:3886 stop:4497 length:612 start_codon:yes stop_codon:yes gene_type:complete
MNINTLKEKAFPFLKTYWFSIILIFWSWFIVKQFYMSLEYNILLAVSYKHVFGFSMIYFVIDNLTLIIHEAGHTIFGIFGWRFLTVLGGTLLQILLPFLLFIVSWRSRKIVVSQASLYWLGFAWLDSAAYCADAYTQDLPLIGNLPKSSHDFLNILSDMNILNHYKTISWVMFVIGCFILITGIALPYFSKKRTETVDLDLKL